MRHKEFKALEDSLLLLDRRLAADKQEARELFSSEDVAKKVRDKLSALLAKLPPSLNMKEADSKFPILYDDSVNTILLQELERYNSLLSLVKSDLSNAETMLRGNKEPEPALETLCDHLLNDTIPDTWRMPHPALGGGHSRSLAQWVEAVCERVHVFADWVANGRPQIFWLSAFWNLPGFLVAVKLNYARRAVKQVDRLEFDCGFLGVGEKPQAGEGVYVRGVYLENAAWEPGKRQLVEAATKQRYCAMPTVPAND